MQYLLILEAWAPHPPISASRVERTYSKSLKRSFRLTASEGYGNQVVRDSPSFFIPSRCTKKCALLGQTSFRKRLVTERARRITVRIPLPPSLLCFEHRSVQITLHSAHLTCPLVGFSEKTRNRAPFNFRSRLQERLPRCCALAV